MGKAQKQSKTTGRMGMGWGELAGPMGGLRPGGKSRIALGKMALRDSWACSNVTSV